MLCNSFWRFNNCSVTPAFHFVPNRYMSAYKTKLKQCLELLNVKEDSDQETIRKSFLNLAKRFHPDSGSPEANAEKFKEIESAFRFLNRKHSQDRWGVDEDKRIKEFDIKHTAPQHRQYLSYEGVGFGTPAQREKQYGKKRASQAALNVMEHRMEKAIASEGALMDKSNNRNQKHNIKTQYGFDRLVEDLIQEAMSKGEFNNLPGSGKPLSRLTNTNPYVDFVTHKVNQILIDNGFTPEWITLQKDIRREVDILRSSLKADRRQLGPAPLEESDNVKWEKTVEKHKQLESNINSKITHYNLVVPILQKQMFLISLDKEADEILKNGTDNSQMECPSPDVDKQYVPQSDTPSFLSILNSIFK